MPNHEILKNETFGFTTYSCVLSNVAISYILVINSSYDGDHTDQSLPDGKCWRPKDG